MHKVNGMPYTTRCIMGLLAAAIACVAGCGGGVKMYPVSGKIVWSDGQPAKELAGGNVIFKNVDPEERTVNIMGEIQPDATFTLRTGQAGRGAPAGEYQVAIMPRLDSTGRIPSSLGIHKRFFDYRTSGLKATIEPKDNTIALELERK